MSQFNSLILIVSEFTSFMWQKQPGLIWLWRRIRQDLHWLTHLTIAPKPVYSPICRAQSSQSLRAVFEHACMNTFLILWRFCFLNFKLQQVYPISVYLSSFHPSLHRMCRVNSTSRLSLPRCWRWKVMNRMLLLINEICCCSLHFSAKSCRYFRAVCADW